MTLILNSFEFVLPIWVVLSATFLLAFLITAISIPTIVTVAEKKGLHDNEGKRSSHIGSVPILGGIAIFAGLIIPVSIFVGSDFFWEFKFILVALLILFFTGIKDDILIMDPKKKLLAQFLAAAIIVVLGDIRITSFQGLALINEIPYIVSILLSVFVFIVIINGFNLIDGIDGLASGITIVTASTFGVWFILVGDYSYGGLSIALVGAMLPFFWFNVFGKKNKIFLGDTGALSIGLIMAILAIHFLEIDLDCDCKYSIASTPAVTFGILIVPLFDTLRVFTLRIFGGASPFIGDRKHIHHRLIELGCSHLRASITITIVNILIITTVFLLNDIGNIKLLFITLSLAALFSYIPVYLLGKRNHR